MREHGLLQRTVLGRVREDLGDLRRSEAVLDGVLVAEISGLEDVGHVVFFLLGVFGILF